MMKKSEDFLHTQEASGFQAMGVRIAIFSLPILLLGILFVYGGKDTQAQAEVIGVYKKWTAGTYKNDGSLVCNMWSEPEKSMGNYTKRGSVYAFVTHFPADKVFSQISLDMGYPIGVPEVSVIIDQKTYVFESDGEHAYAREVDTENLLTAMRRGSRMLVKSRSTRGTDTKDTFSLLGFSKSLQQIDKNCK